MPRWVWIVIGLVLAIGGYLYWQAAQLPADIESKGETAGLDAWLAVIVAVAGTLTAIANAAKAYFEARKAAAPPAK